jgi:hypothetical protein
MRRDVSIEPWGAKQDDAKAELNRRSKVRESLAGTGISRRKRIMIG